MVALTFLVQKTKLGKAMRAVSEDMGAAQLMGISWGALAGAFLAPFLYGLYWKKTTVPAVWVSFLFSTVVMLRAAGGGTLRMEVETGDFTVGEALAVAVKPEHVLSLRKEEA